MTPSSLAALLAGNVKLATAAAATAAVTAGGGMAVANAVSADNPHAAAGLANAAAAQAAHQSATGDTTGDLTAADELAPTTDQPTVVCPTDVTNHGAFVSSVAQTPAPDGAAPNAHGMAVSAAARSDCGKPAGGTAGDSGEEGGVAPGPNGHANSHATTHPSGKPDVTGPTAPHGRSADHLPAS